MRLPGSIAEIEASPTGPRTGAFFDLDGTLVAGYTAGAHARESLRDQRQGAIAAVRFVQLGVSVGLGSAGFEELAQVGADMMKGRLVDELDEMGERVFQQKIVDRMYPEMRDVVEAHQRQGHTVVLSSSATSFQVEPVARYLGIDHVLCNRYEVDDEGVVTGKMQQPILWGPGKANAVQLFAVEHGIDLQRSYFYADGNEDAALMYLVGHPRPTNPGSKLERVARKRGWPILRFTSRSSGGLPAAARTAAGLLSMVPLTAGSVALGLVRRDRRAGINFMLSNYPRLMLSMNGVKANVIGEENLWNRRPAVFIFNHRNMADGLIVASLLERDFSSVAKVEISSSRLMATLGKLTDVAFIDRSNTEAALDSLKPIEELARKGISIIIAPEGTRYDTKEVGPFKKGPFRMAMAAQIPIVPVVLRNAELVCGRNSSTFNPGTVDVAVLEAIPVDEWTLEDLPKRIEEIRQLFIDTLKNWPADDAAETREG